MRIEFHTVLKDKYIEIPNYKEELKGHQIKVVLLDVQKEKNSEDFIEYWTNNPINLDKNLSYLSREEANER